MQRVKRAYRAHLVVKEFPYCNERSLLIQLDRVDFPNGSLGRSCGKGPHRETKHNCEDRSYTAIGIFSTPSSARIRLLARAASGHSAPTAADKCDEVPPPMGSSLKPRPHLSHSVNGQCGITASSLRIVSSGFNPVVPSKQFLGATRYWSGRDTLFLLPTARRSWMVERARNRSSRFRWC